jgi:Xaa-Pro aminopeptidase
MLTADERTWFDAYQARVREALAPILDTTTRAWLLAATIPPRWP